MADAWWTHGIADDRVSLRADELALYKHLLDHHPGVRLAGREGCRDCEAAVAMSRFAMADTAMYLKDGRMVDPARLHFVHHLLEQTADLDQPALTSSHTFTAYLYHHALGAPAHHVCSPDRGHSYSITVQLQAPPRLMTDDRTAALKTRVAELQRDLQYRELDQIGDGAMATPSDLARWVHTAVAARLAVPDTRLSIRVEAPDAGLGPAVYPPPQ
ncbi:hypothetical protein ABZ896_20065 [Streptomyces sp. NPDC047072]|uniref:hypothetical protein n=1 Tax=Streptomyces sp. NPDC047072 TaxID=3154809 RepID=UPI0033D77901